MMRLTWVGCAAIAVLLLVPQAIRAQTDLAQTEPEPENGSATDQETSEALDDAVLEAAPEVVEGEGEDVTTPEQIEEHENGFVMTHHLQLRAGPIGMSIVSDWGYRFWLSNSQGMLLKDTRIDMGLVTRINPSLFWGGVYLEALPLTILKLRAEAQETVYFGTFGFLYDFQSLGADWSPDTLDRIADEGLGETATGQRVFLSGTLQLKVGPIIALYENNYTWYWSTMDGPYFEPLEVFLLNPHDAVWGMVTTLGYLIAPDPAEWYLVLGARHNRHVTRDGDFMTQRLGIMALWKIPKSWWAWGNPVVSTVFQFYLVDEYREGNPYWGLQLTLSF